MDTVYLTCAVVGGTFVVCQFLLVLVGLGGHHDMGGHDVGDGAGHDFGSHDAPGHHETNHDSHANWFVSLLTFRALTAAFAFFGLTGLACRRLELEAGQNLALALAAGALALVTMGWMMRFMSRLNVDGTVRIEHAMGARGTVYLSIPGGKEGAGKVHVNQLNRTIEYKAITAGGPLATGAKIVVVALVSGDTVLVAPAQTRERSTNA